MAGVCHSPTSYIEQREAVCDKREEGGVAKILITELEE